MGWVCEVIIFNPETIITNSSNLIQHDIVFLLGQTNTGEKTCILLSFKSLRSGNLGFFISNNIYIDSVKCENINDFLNNFSSTWYNIEIVNIKYDNYVHHQNFISNYNITKYCHTLGTSDKPFLTVEPSNNIKFNIVLVGD